MINATPDMISLTSSFYLHLLSLLRLGITTLHNFFPNEVSQWCTRVVLVHN